MALLFLWHCYVVNYPCEKKNQIDFTLTGLPVSVGELFLASIVGIFALKEQTFQTWCRSMMGGAWSGLEFTSHPVTTGHSAATAAIVVPSRWMAASREHLRRPGRRGSIPSQGPETQMSYETPGTCLHVRWGEGPAAEVFLPLQGSNGLEKASQLLPADS